jgi:arylsulfatase A-like enzyme
MKPTLAILAIALLAPALPAAATNVIFIMADDLGYTDLGFNNPESFYETPRLDAMAAQAMRFTDAYAACQVCSPTRSSILTGQYPARTRNTDFFGAPNGFQKLPADYDPSRDGNFGNHANRPVLPAPYLARLAAEHTTLAEALKAAGYATLHAGKWHLGPEGSWPEDHGFDINIAGTASGGPYGGNKYFSPYGNPNLPDGPEGEHLPDRLAREVAKFIGENKETPFFVYLPFFSVHTPLIGREDLIEKYRAKKARLGLTAAFESEPPRENRTVQEHAVYAAMVEAMDQAVGTVLDALDHHGVADDTVVIFFSDNGGLSTSEGSPTSNLPLRAGKGWIYEGGIRSPLIIRWPKAVAAGSTSNLPIISTDFYPTLLAACGLDPLPDQHLDGVNLLPVLKGGEVDRGPIFWHYPHWGNQGGIPSSAVRDSDWKLIRFHWRKGTELYHLADDPGERTNLADARPEKTAELNAKLDAFLKDTDALMPFVNPDPADPFEKW